jgi:hypothetical protein
MSAQKKKAYATPQLIKHGSVTQITLGRAVMAPSVVVAPIASPPMLVA